MIVVIVTVLSRASSPIILHIDAQSLHWCESSHCVLALGNRQDHLRYRRCGAHMHLRCPLAHRLHTQPGMVVIVVIVTVLGSRSAALGARDGSDSCDTVIVTVLLSEASARFSGHQLEIDCTHLATQALL